MLDIKMDIVAGVISLMDLFEETKFASPSVSWLER
jgi:hypothetical protein